MRPTADRVREALFSSLGPRVHGAEVLDLFAGTGILGLEALSRGAETAVFVEHSRSVRSTLARNIDTLQFAARSQVVPADALVSLRRFAKENRQFDLVFLDPPYASALLDDVFQLMDRLDVIHAGSVIVAEHPGSVPLTLPKSLQIIAAKRYGGAAVSFIEKPGSCSPERTE